MLGFSFKNSDRLSRTDHFTRRGGAILLFAQEISLEAGYCFRNIWHKLALLYRASLGEPFFPPNRTIKFYTRSVGFTAPSLNCCEKSTKQKTQRCVFDLQKTILCCHNRVQFLSWLARGLGKKSWLFWEIILEFECKNLGYISHILSKHSFWLFICVKYGDNQPEVIDHVLIFLRYKERLYWLCFNSTI